MRIHTVWWMVYVITTKGLMESVIRKVYLIQKYLACREDVASVIRYLCRKRYPVDVVRIVCGLRNQVALSNEKSVKVIHKNP